MFIYTSLIKTKSAIPRLFLQNELFFIKYSTVNAINIKSNNNTGTSSSSLKNNIILNYEDRLPPMPSIRDLLKLYQISALKRLSQNFLLDYKLTNKIVNAAGSVKNFHVVEIGPGPGSITRSLVMKNAAKIYLIEKDKRFQNALKILNEASNGKLEIYWGDVLSFSLKNILPEELKRSWDESYPLIHIIGNLPFSISTPLIIRYLKDIANRDNIWAEYGRVPLTLTFQKEVAERLAADISDPQRSRLSVMSQYLCHVNYKFTIRGSAFIPKPKVDVGVVKFSPRRVPLIDLPFDLVERVVRQTFSFRRTSCRRGLLTLFPLRLRVPLTNELFYESDVNQRHRSIDLSIGEFKRICEAYNKLCEDHPSIVGFNHRAHSAEKNWEEMFGHLYNFNDYPVPVPQDLNDNSNQQQQQSKSEEKDEEQEDEYDKDSYYK